MDQVWGEINNIRATILEEIKQVYNYKIPSNSIITEELALYLSYLTLKINKEIAIYINRKGTVEFVAVGNKDLVQIPKMWVKREQNGLSGIRCIHTHPSGNSRLSSADLSVLTSLKLDAIVALGVSENLIKCSYAFLLPVEGKISSNYQLNAELSVSDIVVLNFSELIASIEKQIKFTGYETIEKAEKALLVIIDWQKDSDFNVKETITELSSLVDTAGLEVADAIVQKRDKVDSSFLIGRGKLEEIALIIQDKQVDCLIFEDALSPSQQNNLTEKLGIKVIDRTNLILDIFAQRARSKEGKIQVELAQLNYLLPRLTGKGISLSRLGSGVGTRGPGETKLETDKRHIRNRIQILKEHLEEVTKYREIQSSSRNKNVIPKVALVGYTNAGKSSLLNLLADESLFVEDKLFATLDPTTRIIELEEGKHKILLTDTVGFIRNLPHQLIAAFKGTLEEAKSADLLIHVIDISNNNYENQIKSVEQVLEQLKISDKPMILVYNKIDLLSENPILPLEGSKSCFISTKTSSGIDQLKTMIKEHSFGIEQDIEFFIPYEKGFLMDKIYNSGKVLDITGDNEGNKIVVSISDKNISEEIRKYIVTE